MSLTIKVLGVYLYFMGDVELVDYVWIFVGGSGHHAYWYLNDVYAREKNQNEWMKMVFLMRSGFFQVGVIGGIYSCFGEGSGGGGIISYFCGIIFSIAIISCGVLLGKLPR